MSEQKTIINLKDVSVTRNNFDILTDINWRVLTGRCCAVVGPNGAGKSALVAVISGYLWPNRGSVTVFGQTYGQVNLQDVRRRIGLIESSRMPHFDETMPIRDVVATGLLGTVMLPPNRKISKQQWQKVDNQISFFKLEEQKNIAIATVSTGEQTKALIARAMVSQPKMLILDEPTSGLDMSNRAVVIEMLNKLRNTKSSPAIVIISHRLDELPQSLDEAVLLKKGKIIRQGSPRDVFTSANLSETFDCEVEVLRKNGSYLASVKI